MEIELGDMNNGAYSNFIESIKSKETRRGYKRDLGQFLDMISDMDFLKYLGHKPKSRSVEDLAESFVELARKNMPIVKSAVKTYLKHLKIKVEKNKMNPNTVSNKIKPIRSLLVSNEIDVSWETIRKMLPSAIKTQDRAYTREEIHNMLEHCSSITDKVIILLFSSGGFRVEAWDYFCWKDIKLFTDKSDNYIGGALRVYRGYPEEYGTFITPEACNMLKFYKSEWQKRFLNDPVDDDPLLASTKYDKPRRLGQKGVKSRVEKIVSKIGLREVTKKKNGRYEVPLDHGFRKFFNTSMRRAKVNMLDKEDMMGHATGLEKHYERYQEEDFERFPEYQKAIPFLTISKEEKYKAEAIQKEDESDRIKVMDTQIKKLNDKLDEVQYGIGSRRSEYEKMQLVAKNSDSLVVKVIGNFLPMILEMMAPEEQKREFWKEIQENKKKAKDSEDRSDSNPFDKLLNCNNDLSLDNVYDSVKSELTEEERQSYEKNRLKPKDHRVKSHHRGFLI